MTNRHQNTFPEWKGKRKNCIQVWNNMRVKLSRNRTCHCYISPVLVPHVTYHVFIFCFCLCLSVGLVVPHWCAQQLLPFLTGVSSSSSALVRERPQERPTAADPLDDSWPLRPERTCWDRGDSFSCSNSINLQMTAWHDILLSSKYKAE